MAPGLDDFRRHVHFFLPFSLLPKRKKEKRGHGEPISTEARDIVI
jgi:hypothetical protein